MAKPEKAPEILGILPLQDAVLFPNTVIPLAVAFVGAPIVTITVSSSSFSTSFTGVMVIVAVVEPAGMVSGEPVMV